MNNSAILLPWVPCDFLLDEAAVAPVIKIRSLWRDDSERMLPGHDGRSNVVYDEAGTRAIVGIR